MEAAVSPKIISSSFTPCYKIGGVLSGVILLVGAVPLAKFNLLPGICLGLGALFMLTIWWKYLRPAAKVAISDEGLQVLDNDRVRIPYEELLSVSRRPGLIVQTMVVRYKDTSGLQRQISFVPSIREGGFLFTAEHIQRLIQKGMNRND
jgi:hypothetical protein